MSFQATLADALVNVHLSRGKRSRIAASLPWARREARPGTKAEFIAHMEARRVARLGDE
jgi:hypothetical protein